MHWLLHREVSSSPAFILVSERGYPKQVLDYWFRSRNPEERTGFWFMGSDTVDSEIREKFASLHEQAAVGDKDSWIEQGPRGTLALIIVLDQFSRNLHRDSAQAFANDARAVELTQKLLDDGELETLDLHEQVFALMPLMHSEDVALHEKVGRARRAMRSTTRLIWFFNSFLSVVVVVVEAASRVLSFVFSVMAFFFSSDASTVSSWPPHSSIVSPTSMERTRRDLPNTRGFIEMCWSSMEGTLGGTLPSGARRLRKSWTT